MQRKLRNIIIGVVRNAVLLMYFGMTDIHMDNVIAHGKYPVIIDTEFMFDRRIEVWYTKKKFAAEFDGYSDTYGICAERNGNNAL